MICKPKEVAVFGLADNLAKSVGLNPGYGRAALIGLFALAPLATVAGYALLHCMVPKEGEEDTRWEDVK
jgi:hypothetical protein